MPATYDIEKLIDETILNDYVFDANTFLALPGVSKIQIRILRHVGPMLTPDGKCDVVNEQDVRRHLRCWIELFISSLERKCLSIDTEDIIIILDSGATLKFKSSEWNTIFWSKGELLGG